MSRRSQITTGRPAKTKNKRRRKMTDEKNLRMAKYREHHADQADRSRDLVVQGKRAEERYEERQKRRDARREEEERRRKAAEAAAAAKAEKEKSAPAPEVSKE